MAKQNKFGTFGGVFTPSVLTILGVIMYLRLTWVVGNAGSIIAALLIIFMAHIVSITTGLSISSISTDKKIRSGGIYYMLSRSLGFPIGGAIGVTIFVATALSISLYIIGFSTSALDVLKDYVGITEITINHLRIAGSIALVLIVVIAYISTSIAIKTQYIILGLIALSLGSIFMGSSAGKGFDTSIVPSNVENIDFSILFAIFFPAVTGFTAGVAMSGDLKNPKLSIPWGTMLAITVGLVVYVALTFFAFSEIPLAEMRNNPNVLVKFSRFPALVIAGIWGATLSSALGGILGGPRILQAMSNDGIMPRFFGKGVGKGNEPRRALMLTFLLAEAGVLIGDLDIIAGIVTMFFMAAYLSINLSCFLEKWASPDFRPQFKIALIIPLLGTVATLLLMIKLDIVSALLSLIVMASIFVWLTRKQLELDSGDVWQSVWSSIVKTGLKKLSLKKTHERNWEPNILLFSGGNNVRSFLLELCKSIIGRNGVISNFDLVENKSAKMLFPKSDQLIVDNNDKDSSIFFRQQECKNVFEGIENIAQTYGFSGIEPNTVVLGWSHNQSMIPSYAHMLNTLNQLDYNVLFVNYDKEKGFGEKRKIDIWWNDLNNVSYFTVQMCKFILRSHDWNGADVRFLYLNNDNSIQHVIKRAMESITKELKNNITIEIVNNELQRKSFYDVIKIESKNSDLTFIDVPLKYYEQDGFIEKMEVLLENLGTTVFVKASSMFNKGEIIDLEAEKRYVSASSVAKDFNNSRIIDLYKSSNTTYNDILLQFDLKFIEWNTNLVDSIYKQLTKVVDRLFPLLESGDKFDGELHVKIEESIKDIQKNRLEELENEFLDLINKYFDTYNNYLMTLPKVKGVRLRKWCNRYFKDYFLVGFYSYLEGLGSFSYELVNVANKVLNDWNGNQDKNDVKLFNELNRVAVKLLSDSKLYSYEAISNTSRNYLNLIMLKMDKSLVSKYESYIPEVKESSISLKYIKNYMDVWKNNSVYLLNQLSIDFRLFTLKYILLPKINDIYVSIYNNHTMVVRQINSDVLNNTTSLDLDKLNNFDDALNNLSLKVSKDKLIRKFEAMRDVLIANFPLDTELIISNNLHEFEKDQSNIETKIINTHRVLALVFDNNIIHPIDMLLKQYFAEIRLILQKIENSVRLLKFSLSERDSEIVGKIETNKKLVEELGGVNEEIDDINARFEQAVQLAASKCSDIFSDRAILIHAEKLKGINNRNKNGKFYFFSHKVNKFKVFLINNFDKLVIKIKDFMTRKSFNDRTKRLINPHSLWMNFMDEVQIGQDVDITKNKFVPFYYQQLFLGRHKAPNTPLRNREVEWSSFNRAYERFKLGTSGAVIFVGEYYSGITYMIENIISVKKFKDITTLEPPLLYSHDSRKSADKIFKLALEANHISEKAMSIIPEGHIFVIEDIELWWTRTQKGDEILEKLFDFINKYSSRHFFILSSNIDFYRLIKSYSSLDNILQETILLQPLKSEQIGNAIMERHLAGGIDVKWKGKLLVNDNHRILVNLMSQITLLSEGNIGVAFYIWLCNLRKTPSNEYVLKELLPISLPDVNMQKWDNLLLQIILHRRLSADQIFDIYKGEDRAKIKNILDSLLRTKVVVEIDFRVYEINRFAMAYVKKYLRKNEYLN